MSIEKIDGSSMSSKIQQYADDCGTKKRKERLDLLNKIAGEGENLIKNLNSADKIVYEIGGEYDTLTEETYAMEDDYYDAIDEESKNEDKITELEERIEELEEKFEGKDELTEEEMEEMGELYDSYDELFSLQSNTSVLNKNINNINDKLTDSFYKIDGYNGTLDNTIELMEGYQKAGEEVKKAANKYGKKNMNCERAMERNEKNWVGNAFSIVHDPVGSATGESLTPETMIISNQKTQMDSYTDRKGLDEVSNQTFYNSSSHEFISEFDAMDDKGGNEIEGKLRRATAKVYSRGKTSSDSSNIVKKKTEDIRED